VFPVFNSTLDVGRWALDVSSRPVEGAFLDICELQVNRTGAGTAFGPLAFDTTPGYTDTEPFPATPTKWTYRAIYRVGDQRVGQWSKSVSITVGG
jgi:hypothetical protein